MSTIHAFACVSRCLKESRTRLDWNQRACFIQLGAQQVCMRTCECMYTCMQEREREREVMWSIWCYVYRILTLLYSPRLDVDSRPHFLQWLKIRLELIAACLVGFVAFSAVLVKQFFPSLASAGATGACMCVYVHMCMYE